MSEHVDECRFPRPRATTVRLFAEAFEHEDDLRLALNARGNARSEGDESETLAVSDEVEIYRRGWRRFVYESRSELREAARDLHEMAIALSEIVDEVEVIHEPDEADEPE